jgi:DNA-binding transcriptional LysR family regulator
MELRQLRYFVAVADELHFAKAAARLLIAGQSLSQQIKALERDLKVTLFERSPTEVALTSAGARLLPLAREALAAADLVTDTARLVAEDRATVLRLGFLAFSLTATSRQLLTEFGRAESGITVQLRQFEWDEPAGGLLSGATDAALVRPPFTGMEGLHLLELAREPVLAVMSDANPLAQLDSITLDDLAGERWLEADGVTDPVFAAFWYLRERRVPSRVRTTTETLEEWLAEVAFGRGVNLVPESLAAELRRPGLVFVEVSDAPESVLALAWPRQGAAPAAEVLARFAAGRSAGRSVGAVTGPKGRPPTAP